MCLFAFHTFSIVGEITSSIPGNTIHLNQVLKLLNDRHEAQAIKVTFLRHKHNNDQAPFSLVVSRQMSCCPVQHVLAYLQVRGDNPGPLFQICDGSPVPRSVFCEKNSAVIKFIGLDASRYKGYSFLFGAASLAADKGMSDPQIQTTWRRKSNAILKYIRIPSMSNELWQSGRGCCHGIFPLKMGLISKGSITFILFHIFCKLEFNQTILLCLLISCISRYLIPVENKNSSFIPEQRKKRLNHFLEICIHLK